MDVSSNSIARFLNCALIIRKHKVYPTGTVYAMKELDWWLCSSVVRLLDFHNRSSKIIVQEVSIDDRL